MRTQIFWKSVWIFEVETFIIFFLKKKNDLHSGLEIEQSVYTLHIHYTLHTSNGYIKIDGCG